MTIYASPRVGRAGLGNCLFPWARAEVFSHLTGARILAPNWTGIRIGPYLRGEADKRRYHGYFHSTLHVRGFAKLFVSTVGLRISEQEARSGLPATRRPLVVEFAGLDELFAPLRDHATLVREQLRAMTVEHLLPAPTEYGTHFIAMHVRRGDLTRRKLDVPWAQVEQYTPLSWFVSMVTAVKKAPGLQKLPVVVFTDGYEDEIAELLSLPGVQLHRRRAAITDIWLLSQSSLLFGSGYSTFSMWASFLGGMPTLYAPGKLQQQVQARRPGNVEIEIPAGEAIPADVCRIAAAR